ncbi:MlaA family lipoprotein [Methylomarinum vadi]|uniref:MlaA family lipoprotein n=1 Tax=Methylomarinum vadi TaxID=438855 RepID=UPI0004DF5F64|nr:VacJ family lipoprotein [Methylomarinum vadi]
MHHTKLVSIVGMILLFFIGGCATTAEIHDPKDPWEGWNRKVQSFNDDLDDYVMKPVAKGYRWVMPGFADRAVSNFFSNIDDIGVTINDLLQGKVAQSGSDGARFLVNTTAGIGGLIDVGSMIDLPKHKEDFGQTLGVWGLSTGPYMVLPFFGPSSPRGVGGLVGDAVMNPITYMGGYVSTGLFALNATDLRADNLAMEKIADEAALDRYIFFRDAYLARRNYLVYDGNPPDEMDVLEFDEEEDGLGPVSPY